MLAGSGLLDTQIAALGVVCLLWLASAVLVKCLHDRNRRGYWGFSVIVAWLLLDLGVFRGNGGVNRFGARNRYASGARLTSNVRW
ncbi:DUF805 domain-containing protein|nr:DUF805 domain-containing protein [Candidatus Pantoea persica]